MATHRDPPEPPCAAESLLAAYWRAFWPRRWFLCATTLGFALAAVGASYLVKDRYRAEIVLAPVETKEVRSGLQSALGNLGGLASIAGIALPGGGDVEENLAVLKSRNFLFRFIEEQNLLPQLFPDRWDAAANRWRDPEKPPTLWEAYRLLNEGLVRVQYSKKSPLVTVAVEWRDPRQASLWGNELILRLNHFLRQRAIERSRKNLEYLKKALEGTQSADIQQTLYALIAEEQKQAMLAATQEEFAFRVIDPAAPPDVKSWPPRRMAGMLGAIAGLLTGMVAIVVKDAASSRPSPS